MKLYTHAYQCYHYYLVGSTKLADVLPPERICVALVQKGNSLNIGLQLSWTRAIICNPSALIGSLGYLVRYKDINMIEETMMVDGLLLELSTRGFTSNAMYYFQVASVVSLTSGEIMSPFSHCINVTIIKNTLSEQCQTVMYECDDVQTTNNIIQSMGTDAQTQLQSTSTDFTAVQLGKIMR